MKLPSVRAAENFHAGKPGGLTEILVSTIGRSFIIGTGIYLLTSERDLKRLAAHSIAGATAIEMVVLYYTRPTPNGGAKTSPPPAPIGRLPR
jgi:hypothetical protein